MIHNFDNTSQSLFVGESVSEENCEDEGNKIHQKHNLLNVTPNEHKNWLKLNKS